MAMYKPQQKHRAQHNNYRKRPSRSEVLGLLNFYAVAGLVENKRPRKKIVGVQLKLDL